MGRPPPKLTSSILVHVKKKSIANAIHGAPHSDPGAVCGPGQRTAACSGAASLNAARDKATCGARTRGTAPPRARAARGAALAVCGRSAPTAAPPLKPQAARENAKRVHAFYEQLNTSVHLSVAALLVPRVWIDDRASCPALQPSCHRFADLARK